MIFPSQTSGLSKHYFALLWKWKKTPQYNEKRSVFLAATQRRHYERKSWQTPSRAPRPPLTRYANLWCVCLCVCVCVCVKDAGMRHTDAAFAAFLSSWKGSTPPHSRHTKTWRVHRLLLISSFAFFISAIEFIKMNFFLTFTTQWGSVDKMEPRNESSQ